MKAVLVLEDGSVYAGAGFGAEGTVSGEVVFNTSMTGYEEVLTDPSYKGQIVTMTYPLIGNCGANDEDMESSDPKVQGFVVREACRVPNNWRNEMSIDEMLARYGIVGIEGIDTRALTRKLRNFGTMKGVISTDPGRSIEELVSIARKCPDVDWANLVRQVTTQQPYVVGEGDLHVVLVDYGVKRNSIRSLNRLRCKVTVVPAFSTADEIMALSPDGILLSNGPGDPKDIEYATRVVREIIDERPIMGICLGHQVLCRALGAETYKLKFGHRGGNHPVKDLESGQVYITSQNHGYAVAQDSLDPDVAGVSQINLNDGTVEGIRHRRLPVFSVQYHPEAAPGPGDTAYLFERFVAEIRNQRSERSAT